MSMLEQQSRQWDEKIRELVVAFNLAGLATDWCCAGNTDDHMSIRPIVQIRTLGTFSPNDPTFRREYSLIVDVLMAFGIENAWVMLNFARGDYNTHGGEPTWIVQLPGRYDLTTALPVAYSKMYQTPIDRDPNWHNIPYRPLVLSDTGVKTADWETTMTTCTSCGAPIAFKKTKNGKRCPYDVVNGTVTATSHFKTCPHARSHSKQPSKKEKKSA